MPSTGIEVSQAWESSQVANVVERQPIRRAEWQVVACRSEASFLPARAPIRCRRRSGLRTLRLSTFVYDKSVASLVRAPKRGHRAFERAIAETNPRARITEEKIAAFVEVCPQMS